MKLVEDGQCYCNKIFLYLLYVCSCFRNDPGVGSEEERDPLVGRRVDARRFGPVGENYGNPTPRK